jgi:hypothetical protein
MVEGNQVAIVGKAVNIAKAIIISKKKGMLPRTPGAIKV